MHVERRRTRPSEIGFFATAAADIGDADSGPLNQPQIVRER